MTQIDVTKRVSPKALKKDILFQSADEQQVIADCVLPDDMCQTQDPVSSPNQVIIETSLLLI